MKVGDYVRTDIGEIRKVVKVTDDLYVLDKDIVFAHKDKIKKSSPKIIDLIEIGDYINGYLVIDIVKGFKVIIDKLELDTTTGLYYNIGIIDIKSIVTREQYEEMEYKIND